MNLDWLKSILDKFDKYSILWACLGCAIFAIKYPNKSKWWLVLVFCAICLLVDGVRRLRKHIVKQKIANNEIKKEKAENERKIEKKHVEIWQIFLVLKESSMEYLVKIFKNENKDPENIYVRFVENNDKSVSWNLNKYLTFFHIVRESSDFITLEIDPYFYKLIEHYIKTGKKERIRL
jgi:hypothetical protein